MVSMGRDTLVITGQPALPLLNQFTYVFDSTKALITAIAASAASQSPGNYRHRWAGGRVRGSIKNGDQAITVTLQCMTNSAGTTSAAFETDTTAQNGGTFSLAASTTVLLDWLPRTNDYRVEIQAGATATSAITTTCRIDFDPSPAV